MKTNKNLQETKLKIFPTGTHNEFHITLIYYIIAGNFGETGDLANSVCIDCQIKNLPIELDAHTPMAIRSQIANFERHC